jgi:phosphonate transport system ATP-binding protein
MPLIVADMHKRYGNHTVLQGVSLQVQPGELVALTGSSGVGKTTLFRCIARLAEPDRGRVLIDGRDLMALEGGALRATRRQIAVIFQQFNLVKRSTVLRNVLAGRLGRVPLWRVAAGAFPSADIALAEDCLARVGLAGAGRRLAGSLSGGQQQRVAIARALAQESRFLLADEPVASLDPDNAQRVMTLLRQLVDVHKMAVLCTLHQPALADRYADRVLTLSGGLITPAAVEPKPQPQPQPVAPIRAGAAGAASAAG